MKRFLEIFLPGISWFIILLPFWLSFWHPAIVAYFVIGFDVYWFYKSANLAINSLRSYIKLNRDLKIDWLRLCRKIPGWDSLYHVIIIPEYQEPLSVLRETLSGLTQQDFPLKRIFLVLATEAKDPQSTETSRLLQQEFSQSFGRFWITSHVLQKNEVMGKSSNMAWAGRFCVKKLTELNIDLKNVIVTSCDSDVLLHTKYFSCLSYKFLQDSDRFFHFYQAAIMFYNNIWKIPLPGRVLNTLYSLVNLANLSQNTHRLINFSTYSLSLKTVKEVGFWGVDVIPEDYHLFFKTYFQKGKKVEVKPIFLPALADAAESHGFWRTMVNQYEQNKRWAWGISDDPWVLKNCLFHQEIPLYDRVLRLFNVLEQHILWPTNWFILTLGSSLPPLINSSFSQTVLGHNLARISSTILTICLIFLLCLILIDVKLKPVRPKDFKLWKIPGLFLQWLTLPIVSLFLSALPGLDAHTRLMMGRKLEYRVTEKI